MVDLIQLILIEKIQSSMPEVKMTEVDEGQETGEEKGDLTTVPAVLIKILPFETRDLSNGVQEADIQVEIKLITKSHRSKNNKIRHNATGHAALASKLYTKLTGQVGKLSEIPEFSAILPEDDYEIFNSMTRTAVDPEHDKSAIITTIQTFDFYAKDYSANKQFEEATAEFFVENL